jgi:SSS family solute:Na+ symporter
MSIIDWIVLALTILSIVFYGIWKSRGTHNISGYLLADKQLPWYHVGLSVMATQASAITFLAAPGQAFSDGLRFIQIYFGLPMATVVICVTFIPKFRNLNVYTAYEYLENRFDIKTRSLTAFLFLVQRGLSTGVTIYAPSIILSVILHTDIMYTTFFIGCIVITYTTYGGTKAVSYTQLLQMSIIFAGLFFSAWMVVHMLPKGVGFSEALHIAGKMNKLNAIDTHFDLTNKYNLWSGIIGGFFLQLSYLGTDQSQVGRYLTGSSITESRLGLVMNGLIKIPMQFLILLIGTLIFTFYQFHRPPVFFNTLEVDRIENSAYKNEYKSLETEYNNAHSQKEEQVNGLVKALHEENEQAIADSRIKLQASDSQSSAIRTKVMTLMLKNNSKADINDNNYVFLNFVMTYLPKGIIGILIAIILLAAMGSTASALNSLASTSIVDFYKRFYNKTGSDHQYLSASRWATVGWGFFCIAAAMYCSKLGNLIEAVNVLGSLFYGTILGIFFVAFYMKKVGGNAVFAAALIAEVFVFIAWMSDLMAFLWLNAIGCLLVMGISLFLQRVMKEKVVSR